MVQTLRQLGYRASLPTAPGQHLLRLHERLTDLAIWVPTVTPNEIDFLSSRVRNYQYNPVWGALIDQFWKGVSGPSRGGTRIVVSGRPAAGRGRRAGPSRCRRSPRSAGKSASVKAIRFPPGDHDGLKLVRGPALLRVT